MGNNASSPNSRQRISHDLMLKTSSLPKLFYTLLGSKQANLMPLNQGVLVHVASIQGIN